MIKICMKWPEMQNTSHAKLGGGTGVQGHSDAKKGTHLTEHLSALSLHLTVSSCCRIIAQDIALLWL